jgi:hypothetical protein
LELVKSQEMIVKLNETISQLQRENSLAKIRLEGHINANPELADADIVTIIQNMEEKHGKFSIRQNLNSIQLVACFPFLWYNN